MDLERDLGVEVESSVQTALTGTWVLWLLNHAYLAAQLVVLPGALIFLYHRSRPLYERLRNTILATWLLSIPVYGLFPVAPPRLADSGLVDTISSQTGFAMDSSLTTAFYNELAAVPSLHVGFAFAVGIDLAASFRNPVVKLIAHLWGPAIALAVVATGNHYVFDIVAGMVAAALGYGMAPRGPPRPAEHEREQRPDDGEHRARADEERRQALGGHGAAGDVSKLAASTATPAPTEAGANGTQPAAALGEQDEQQHSRRDRQREGGEEAGQRADPAGAAGELPRQHRPRVGGGRAQRRAAARQPGGDAADGGAGRGRRGGGAGRRSSGCGRSGARRAARRRRRRARAAARRGRARRRATSAAASSGDPDDGLAGALGDERAGQHRAAGLPEPAARAASTRTASPPRADTSPPAPAPATHAAIASRRRSRGSSPEAVRTSAYQPRPRVTWLARCRSDAEHDPPRSGAPATAPARSASARSRAAAASPAASHIAQAMLPLARVRTHTPQRRGRRPAPRSGLRRAMSIFAI